MVDWWWCVCFCFYWLQFFKVVILYFFPTISIRNFALSYTGCFKKKFPKEKFDDELELSTYCSQEKFGHMSHINSPYK